MTDEAICLLTKYSSVWKRAKMAMGRFCSDRLTILFTMELFATRQNVSQPDVCLREEKSESKQMSALRSKCLLEKVMGREKNLSHPRSSTLVYPYIEASCAIGDKAWCAEVSGASFYLRARSQHSRADCYKEPAAYQSLPLNYTWCVLSAIFHRAERAAAPVFSLPRPGDRRQAPHVLYNMEVGRTVAFWCLLFRGSFFWKQPHKMQTSERFLAYN